jgi:glycine oxidase
MIHKKVDYLIVGQGLAGSCLAIQLMERGKTFVVFDQPQLNKATAVAAGLFNPITGRVMSKTWKADLLFPCLFSFYKNAEIILRKKFFFPQNLYRPFLTIEEQNEWMAKSEAPELKDYIEKVFVKSTFSNQVRDSMGGLLLKQCGYLDTLSFMAAVRTKLNEINSYREENFNPESLKVTESHIEYDDFRADKIIFCGGIADALNIWFAQLPLRPLKGETLQVKLDQSLDHIYNRGVYVVSCQGELNYKVGATYSTQDKTTEVTETARKELMEKLDDLIPSPYEITHQDWGIRPTTADRRPIIGSHPREKKIVIFNGLGTKGVSLAPYFSGQLASWLMGEGGIDKEVSIERFYSKM